MLAHFRITIPPSDNSLKDEDVIAEEQRLLDPNSGATESSTILVKDMKKVYPGGKYAVKGVSIGIPNGECFGLLGINGAGNSTTLAMLSGEFKPSSGNLINTANDGFILLKTHFLINPFLLLV